MKLIPNWLRLAWPDRRPGRRETEARPESNRSGRPIRARYDAAETTDENARHWSAADGLSANAASSSEVRRTLRNRARYEVGSNSYAKGIVLTLANDTMGTGPRLQMLTDQPELNRYVEHRFARHAESIRLAEKLRTMRMARAQDGEAFGLLTSNPALQTSEKLDLRLLEADQVTTPDRTFDEDGAVDGIRFDEFGNPIEYHVLRHHPGEMSLSWDDDYVRVPAESMVHYFREDRPGQSRGIPEITPALPLFAQLRRYTLAVLSAAETAADFAAVIYTDNPAGGEAEAVEPLDRIMIERRMGITLPGGWKMGQFRAEHPSTTYAEFKHELLNEIARCLNLPYNVAAGNSSGYNYASGRLDHQTYYKSLRVEQATIGLAILDRFFAAWLAEAILVDPVLSKLDYKELAHQWFWDGQEHVDPAKEANALKTRLNCDATTLAYEYARMGRDWEAELRQRAKEKALMKELGLVHEDVPPTPGEKKLVENQQAA